MITVTFAWWQVLLFCLGVVIYQIIKHVMKLEIQKQLKETSSAKVYMGEQPD